MIKSVEQRFGRGQVDEQEADDNDAEPEPDEPCRYADEAAKPYQNDGAKSLDAGKEISASPTAVA